MCRLVGKSCVAWVYLFLLLAFAVCCVGWPEAAAETAAGCEHAVALSGASGLRLTTFVCSTSSTRLFFAVLVLTLLRAQTKAR